jgi:signal transduction histidine kinase
MGSVRKICETLGIAIEVSSTPNVGTQFRFVLPDTPATEHVSIAV